MDPFFFTTKLVLPFDGADGSTTFTDHAFLKTTLTANGNARLSTAQSVSGGSSLYLDGTDDWLQTTDLEVARLGPHDFTIEMWVKTSKAPCILVNSYSGSGVGWVLDITAAGLPRFREPWSGTFGTLTGVTAINNNAWHHVAVCRNGTTIRLFVDGAIEFSVTTSAQVNNDAGGPTTSIGANTNRILANTPLDFAGYIDGFKMNIRVGYYVEAFTPPTTLETTGPTITYSLAGLVTDLGVVEPTPDLNGRAAIPAVSLYDAIWGGNGQIAGTVKLDGTPDVPVRRRVRLHRDVDGMLVREQWSNPVTGAYSFNNIDRTLTYTVLTYDHTQNFRAVVADRITPDLMP